MDATTILLVSALAAGFWHSGKSKKDKHKQPPSEISSAQTSSRPDPPAGYGHVGRWPEEETTPPAKQRKHKTHPAKDRQEPPPLPEGLEEMPEETQALPSELVWLRDHIQRENPHLAAEEVDRVALALSQASTQAGVPLSFLVTVVQVESNFNPLDQSPTGAAGLGQLMPGTAADLGVADPFDPFQNALGAATYLRRALDVYATDPDASRLALASYRIGPGAVSRGLTDRATLFSNPILVSYFSRFDGIFNQLP